MKQIVDDFNSISLNFLKQTAPLTNKEYLFKFKMSKTLDKYKPIDLFIKNILPHRERIVKRDETFFLTYTNHTSYTADISHIQKIYPLLDDDSKNNTWNIILSLLLLAEQRYTLNNKHNALAE